MMNRRPCIVEPVITDKHEKLAGILGSIVGGFVGGVLAIILTMWITVG